MTLFYKWHAILFMMKTNIEAMWSTNHLCNNENLISKKNTISSNMRNIMTLFYKWQFNCYWWQLKLKRCGLHALIQCWKLKIWEETVSKVMSETICLYLTNGFLVLVRTVKQIFSFIQYKVKFRFINVIYKLTEVFFRNRRCDDCQKQETAYTA